MYVRKVRGQERVGKITVSASEVEFVRKQGLALEDYVRHALDIIAKQRRWKWYFNRSKP